MIDWHCHILPAIDDGPETLAESLEMARLLVAAGFRQVHCTPHCVLGQFDNRPSPVQRATAELQKELSRAGIPLSLSPGMEYPLDEYFPALLEQAQCLGDSRLLLVEIPQQASIDLVRENVRQIFQRGLIPLMAHPERSNILWRDDSSPKWWSFTGLFKRLRPSTTGPSLPDTATPRLSLQDELQGMGCLFQANILGFSGRYGRQVQERAVANLTQGLYSCFGSDGHDAESLETCLLPALQFLTDHEGGLELSDSSAGLVGPMGDHGKRRTQTPL